MHFWCCPGNNNDMWKKHKITFEVMLWWHWCCLHITAQSFSETQSALKAFAMLYTVWISTAECILSESIGSKIWQELKLQFTWIKVTVRIYEVVRWENSYVVPHWGSQKYGDEISRYGMNCKILVLLWSSSAVRHSKEWQYQVYNDSRSCNDCTRFIMIVSGLEWQSQLCIMMAVEVL